MHYALARHGIFATVQGEGALLGVPMVFVRLAGCSIGCAGCDTDYGVAERLTVEEITARVRACGPCAWSWITGGEPADRELAPLVEGLRLCGRVALATSGHRSLGGIGNALDFLAVSPHGTPADLVLRRGSQLNLVPGLGGLELADWTWDRFPFAPSQFPHAYVTPCDGKPETLAACLAFLKRCPADTYRLGVQAHKQWGLP
jgi:7-carboxy-7-deazaguanine synthase